MCALWRADGTISHSLSHALGLQPNTCTHVTAGMQLQSCIHTFTGTQTKPLMKELRCYFLNCGLMWISPFPSLCPRSFSLSPLVFFPFPLHCLLSHPCFHPSSHYFYLSLSFPHPSLFFFLCHLPWCHISVISSLLHISFSPSFCCYLPCSFFLLVLCRLSSHHPYFYLLALSFFAVLPSISSIFP